MFSFFKRFKNTENQIKVEELTAKLSEEIYEKESLADKNKSLINEITLLKKQLEVADEINDEMLKSQEEDFNQTIDQLKAEFDTRQEPLENKIKFLSSNNEKLINNNKILTNNNRKLELELSKTKASKTKKEVIVRSKPIDQNQEIYHRYVTFLEKKAEAGEELDHFEHLSLRYRLLPMSRKVERVGGSYDRLAYEKALPHTLNDLEWKKILNRFDGKCALSGITENTSIEHFIPISTGHGGTYKGNVFPLNVSLNYSKNNRNPFYWFSKNDFPVAFTPESWDALIQYLAEENGLEVNEYVAFVNWCFDNPRTLEQIKADGDISSLELWRKDTQQLKKVI